MPRPPARSAALAVALALLVLLGVCSDGGDSAAAPSTATTRHAAATTSTTGTTAVGAATPTAGAPVVGDCIEPVTPTSVAGPQLPAIVPCSDPHGGEIVTVATLTDAPDADYPAVTDLTASAATVAAVCQGTGTDPTEFDKFVGDNRLRSAATGGQAAGAHEAWIVSSLVPVLFVPGTAAWSHGARWAACAAVLENSTGAVAEYDGSARGLRTAGSLPEAFGWCRTDEDQGGKYDIVSCDRPHSLEQLASFRVGGKDDAYPGNDQIDQLAGQLCPALASTATSKRSDSIDESKFGLSWTFPRQEDWEGGDRTGRCYLRSLKQPTTGSFAAGTA